MNYTPYVYYIKNITTGLKYIGSKYAKNAIPDTFWINYFTSSIKVKQLISTFGKEDFVFKILKKFDNAYDALEYENKLNRLAFFRKDYLNNHYNFLGDRNREKFEIDVLKQKKSARFTCLMHKINGTAFHGRSKEKIIADAKAGGLAAGKINRLLGRAIFDPAVRRRQHETLRERKLSAYYNPEIRAEICSKGGENGFYSKVYYEKNGLSETSRIEAASNAGKIGGPKNKGFRWYNDSINSFKYTPKQIEIKPFDEFIRENKSFFVGRMPEKIKRVWCNNGKKNFFILEEDRIINNYTHGRLGDRKKYGAKNRKDYKEQSTEANG
jgi:general stress protein YciG